MSFKCIDLFTAHSACSFLGSDIKGNTIVPEPETTNSYEDQSLYFFEKYSKDLLVEVKEHFWKVDPNQYIAVHGSSMGFLEGPPSRHGACSLGHSWENAMYGHPLESTEGWFQHPTPYPCGYQNPDAQVPRVCHMEKLAHILHTSPHTP